MTAIIRPYAPQDRQDAVRIINAAAQAYRGEIPDDCWHEPYMAPEAVDAEIATGVEFLCYATGDGVVALMGAQLVRNVRLIRHAYVLPEWQGHGIGATLIAHLCRDGDRPILVGTWQAATWAIRFYERQGFVRVAEVDIARLLRSYWTISDRQVETSVVLARPTLGADAVAHLLATGGGPS
jgi:GNAT superfamily N-acetyltransferase